MAQWQETLKKHNGLFWGFALGSLIFFGCTVFPLIKTSGGTVIVLLNLYTFIMAYGYIGVLLAMLLGAGAMKKAAGAILFFTATGLLCRYLLEFGEISNVYNFTAFHVIGYFLITLAYCLAMYKAAEHKLFK